MHGTSWRDDYAAHMVPVFGEPLAQLVRGEGAWVWDDEGRRLLDFVGGIAVNALGYAHPVFVETVHRQAATLTQVSNYFASPPQLALAARLLRLTGADARDGRVFFTNSGTEAIEAAIKLARRTDRPRILALVDSFHGRTMGALSVTGKAALREPFEPLLPGVEFIDSTAAALEAALGDDVAALIVEPIKGEAGVLPLPEGYLEAARELTARHGALLILDEIQTGAGRTGQWFAFQGFDVTPDLVTFAKGVNSGYVPLGGVVISEAIHNSFADRPFPGGLTYSGHPLGAAAGVATFDIFEREGILERVRDLGDRVVAPRLAELAEKHPSVGETRGVGLFWALELVTDRDTKAPLQGDAYNSVMAACKSAGLWPFAAGNRLQIAPPLVISEEDLVRGLDIIDAALDVADSYYQGA